MLLCVIKSQSFSLSPPRVGWFQALFFLWERREIFLKNFSLLHGTESGKLLRENSSSIFSLLFLPDLRERPSFLSFFHGYAWISWDTNPFSLGQWITQRHEFRAIDLHDFPPVLLFISKNLLNTGKIWWKVEKKCSHVHEFIFSVSFVCFHFMFCSHSRRHHFAFKDSSAFHFWIIQSLHCPPFFDFFESNLLECDGTLVAGTVGDCHLIEDAWIAQVHWFHGQHVDSLCSKLCFFFVMMSIFFDGPENLVFVRWYKNTLYIKITNCFCAIAEIKCFTRSCSAQTRPPRMTNNRKLKKPYYFTFSFSLRSFSQFMFFTFAYNWARESQRERCWHWESGKFSTSERNFPWWGVFRSGEKRKSYSHLKWIDTCRERLRGIFTILVIDFSTHQNH